MVNLFAILIPFCPRISGLMMGGVFFYRTLHSCIHFKCRGFPILFQSLLLASWDCSCAGLVHKNSSLNTYEMSSIIALEWEQNSPQNVHIILKRLYLNSTCWISAPRLNSDILLVFLFIYFYKWLAGSQQLMEWEWCSCTDHFLRNIFNYKHISAFLSSFVMSWRINGE